MSSVVDYAAGVPFYARYPEDHPDEALRGTIPTRERLCPGTAFGKCQNPVVQKGVSRAWLEAIGRQAEGFRQCCEVDPKTGNTWHPRACAKCLRAEP